MQRVPAKHRALGRSNAELDARDPSPANPHISSIPVVGPLVSPLVGNGADNDAQSSSPDPQPAATPAANNGGDGGNGGGSTPTPTASPAGGGGTAVLPVPTVSSPSSPTSVSGQSSSSSGVNKGSGGGSTANSPSLGGSGDVAGGKSDPGNAGSPIAASAAFGTSTPGALAAGFSSQYSSGSGFNTAGAASLSPTATPPVTASSGKQLSGGAIAGITTVCLIFLLILILLIVRRRSIARRGEIRGRWWFGRFSSGGDSSLVDNRKHPGLDGESPARRLSARSSFATNFDQGLMLHAGSPQRFSPGIVPDLPPQAEFRECNTVSISTGGAIARKGSMKSLLTNGSEPDAQYLTASSQDQSELSTPMSVRPFSPSESFAFPKPPAPPLSTADSFFLPGTEEQASHRSSTTLVHLSSPPRALMPSSLSAPVSPPLHPQTSTSNVSLSPSVTTASPSPDPFGDPEKSGFADVEVIRRPFNPSLDDELVVRPGDLVRLLRIFDDGWAFIEKLAVIEGEHHERGLIPVDCLRETSQALPSFLVQKRVSSHGLGQPTAIAL